MSELDALLLYLSTTPLPMVFESIPLINLVRVLHLADLVEAEIPGTMRAPAGDQYDGPAVVLALTRAGTDALTVLAKK